MLALRDLNAIENVTPLTWRPKHIAGPPPTICEEIDAVLAVYQQQADEDNHPSQCIWELPSGRVLKIICEPGKPDISNATATMP